MNTTFFLIKPDSVDREIAIDIMERLTSLDFLIKSIRKVKLDATTVEKLYSEHTIDKAPVKFREMKKGFLIKYHTSNYCIYLKVKRMQIPESFISIFNYAKYVMGSRYYPELCRQGSIRFDFRDISNDNKWKILEHTKNYGNVAGEIVYNLIHTPGTIDEFKFQNRILENFQNIELTDF